MRRGRGGRFGANGGRTPSVNEHVTPISPDEGGGSRQNGDQGVTTRIVNDDCSEPINTNVNENEVQSSGYASLDDDDMSDPENIDDILPPLHFFDQTSNIAGSSGLNSQQTNITSTSTTSCSSIEYPTTFKWNEQDCVLLYELDGCVEKADKMSRKIWKLFSNGTDKTGYDWKHVSKAKRIVYWREFKKQCVWHSAINALVKKAYRAKVKERYKSFTYFVRHSENKPYYLDRDSWNEWRRHWATPEYQHKSIQNQRNRNATPSLHTGGSISHSEHKRRLKKTLDREPQIDEFFEHLHLRKKVSARTFVDDRSRNCHERYHQIIEEHVQSSSGLDSEQPAEPTKEQQLSAFLEAAGGLRKGRVYGIGTEQHTLYSHLQDSSMKRTITLNQMQLQHQREIEEINRLHEERQARNEEINVKNEKKIMTLESKLEDAMTLITQLFGGKLLDSAISSRAPPVDPPVVDDQSPDDATDIS